MSHETDASDDHGSSRPENRLAGESSPYLQLHRHNPVDWYPWGPEALEKARREDKPIFLSVGYSTCYWCHVMERESFSDPAIAEGMNRGFVNVKVDREERPDLDEIYMTATQILTGHGGWPNSVFLTPELKPFYAGTYFPPEDRYGRPGFASLLGDLEEAWEKRRTEVLGQAEELTAAMRRYVEERAQPGEAPPPADVFERALAGLGKRFDSEWAGFGGAPKFPTPSNLWLLLAAAEGGDELAPAAADMLHATLDQMARGGIFDQLGGGFHRYATDRAWRVPHFEKMLYDNGLLLEVYAREHGRTKDPEMARVVRETVRFLEREMSLDAGGFASAIDAETEGREGAFYVWRRRELMDVLGGEDFEFAAPLLGFAGVPFFEDEFFVLHLPERLDVQAKRRRTSREELLAELDPLREKLLDARGRRPRPLTDDKVLADWNGMVIRGLAVAGRLLGEADYVRRAVEAAEFVLANLRLDGRLHHAWRGGEAKVPGMLSDYVYLVRGLLGLHRASGEARWLAAAAELAEEQEEHLADGRGGYFVAEERDDLLLRSKEVFDGAVPGANAVAVLNALELAEATGGEAAETWRQRAHAALAAAAPLVEQFPDGGRAMAVAVRRWYEGPGGAGATGDADRAGDAGDTSLAAREEEARRAVREAAADPDYDSIPNLTAAAVQAVEAEVTVEEAGDGGWSPFRLRLKVEEGMHLNAAEVDHPSLVPTTLAASKGELRRVEMPPGETLEQAGETLSVYQGEVEITGEVRPEEKGVPHLLLTYQACDDRRCLPQVTRRVRL